LEHFISSNKIYLEIEKKQDNFLSKILTKLTEKIKVYWVAFYGFFMGSLLMNQIDSLGYHFSDLLLIQTVLSTLIVLTAEFLPKFFQIYANGLIKFFALPAYVFYLLFYFISSFLISVSDFVLKNSLERMGIRYSFILVKSSLEIHYRANE
jgi:CBS domain containing-hemolysin-like protein